MAGNGKLTLPYWSEDPAGNFFTNFGSSTFCCYVIQCDPAAVDCQVSSNWSSPYHIPITTANSPHGVPYLYGSSFITSSFGSGMMGMGLADMDFFDYGHSGSVMMGLPMGDRYGLRGGTESPCNKYTTAAERQGLPLHCQSQEFSVGYIGSNNEVTCLARNNIENFSGGIGKIFALFRTRDQHFQSLGISTDSGTTWHLAQSSLTLFHGPNHFRGIRRGR